MDRGDLVPDAVVIGMIRERLDGGDGGFLLDGFPRTLAQAEALDALLAELGTPLDATLALEVSHDELVRRLGGRWICRRCGRSFHETSAPYDPESDPCPAGGGACDLYQRDDDRSEAVENRLRVYATQTQPLIDYYDAQGLLRRIDGERDPDAVYGQITSALARR
jgi:adenylate kinase